MEPCKPSINYGKRSIREIMIRNVSCGMVNFHDNDHHFSFMTKVYMNDKFWMKFSYVDNISSPINLSPQNCVCVR